MDFSKIEDQIVESILMKHDKNLSEKEVDPLITKEIKARKYLSEKWQEEYARERIKEKIKASRTRNN